MDVRQDPSCTGLLASGLLSNAYNMTHHRRYALVGLLILASLAVQCHRAATREDAAAETVRVEPAKKAKLAAHSAATDPLLSLMHATPLAFLEQCRERYEEEVQDYTVRFTKQERLRGAVRTEQETFVKFRKQPYSVNMEWVRNADDAAHVIYVEERWKDDDGTDMAWCKPAGAIAKLFIDKILQPIHGRRAQKASRRTIDQFGFANTLDLIIKYSRKAKAEGLLNLRYTGEGSIEGRPTFVFERILPYTGQEEPYPDRLLVFHIDQEWLLPTACFSYADDQGQELLGKYLLTNAEFNVGLNEADFAPELLED